MTLPILLGFAAIGALVGLALLLVWLDLRGVR